MRLKRAFVRADYTLFVPPEADIATALTTLTDSALATYFDAHTLPQRLVLPLDATDFTSAAGGTLSVSIDGVSLVTNGQPGPVVGVPDAGRDILLDGGILQVRPRLYSNRLNRAHRPCRCSTRR